jgi:sec-independent protein translocase protein TatC
MAETNPPGMNLLDHLEEFRRRVILALAGLAVGVLVAWFFSGRILDLLTLPVDRLVFLSPPEAFITRLKVAVIAGLALASPWVFYHAWRFVRPALMAREARYVTLAVAACTVFFLGGFAFALFVVVPIGVKFLMSFETAKLEPLFSIDRYVSFVSQILFAAGVVFQLPVVLFFLTKLGIVNPKMLRRGRRVAIVLFAGVAAVLTPPDVISQLLLLIPLVGLYELGILGSVIARRGRPGPG